MARDEENEEYSNGEHSPSVIKFVQGALQKFNSENTSIKKATTPLSRARIERETRAFIKGLTFAPSPGQTLPSRHGKSSGRSSVLVGALAEMAYGDSADNEAMRDLSNGRFGAALDADDIDEAMNGHGQTPRHFLALLGFQDALRHPNADKIKDKRGRNARDLYKLGLSQWIGTQSINDKPKGKN